MEKYRIAPRNYRTDRYWLMKAGPEGVKPEDHVKGSQPHAFKTSLPLSQEVENLEGRR